jgi:hypothetical protein
MRPSESGRITFKAILSLAFLAAVIYAAFKVIPVYVNNYQLQDFIQGQTPYWLTQRTGEEAVRKIIMAKAQDLDLPLTDDDLTVEANQNRVVVKIDLHVPVDLKLFTLPLHFTDSSENKSII